VIDDAPWALARHLHGTFFNVTQQDTDENDQWAEVQKNNEEASPSVLLGFSFDPSSVSNEFANCTSVFAKYSDSYFLGRMAPGELVQTMKPELEAAGWDRVRQEAQRQIDEWKNAQ
jgi:putative aldouronate transport system substrate-binding protein